ncbi:MAG: pilus assembly protein TadG-related protein, partial [Planctomycetia bacterium]|nr:pilus assembly protein TadG-related protein [Planctomycetia bacterium]
MDGAIRKLFAGHEDGQAIFLVVGFFLLLAGMLFLVVNTGDQLNNKVSMQNAADAATATGAAWYARGLNIISMCNATEAQILSFILLLDTLEESVPPAKAIIDDLMANLGSSAAGRDMPTYEPIAWLAVSEARGEKDIIDSLHRIITSLPISEYCTYDTGVLWQVCYMLDAFAEEMVELTPLMAQEQAMRVAQENNAEFGFIVPLWPALPVRQATFEDFRLPMRHARMPLPDDEDIGGFKKLFYPDWKMGRSGGPRTPPYATGGRFGGGGPFSHFREPLVDTQPMGLFDISHFATMVLMVSDYKFRMMFGSTDDRLCVSSIELDYDKALKIHEAEMAARVAGVEREVKILRTWWEDVDFDAKEEFPTQLFYDSIEKRYPQNPETVTRSYGEWRAAPYAYTRSQSTVEAADPRLSTFYKSTLRKTASYPAL